MESPENSHIAATLAGRIGENPDAQHVAHAVVAILGEVATALTPVIGQRGVLALYKRSLALTAPSHPWLHGMGADLSVQLDLPALQTVLEQQAASDARSGAMALLQALHALLASLVGSSLTERLLRSACLPSSSGPAAQDPS